tara:strand:- start:768 stop:995 length:228 start_codon:yes stop_codon:yes gene_type:complete
MKDTREIADADYAKEYVDWHIKTGGFARDMTLRDWYMGTVVQGLLTAEIVGDYSNEHVAEIASVITDAILKERAK